MIGKTPEYTRQRAIEAATLDMFGRRRKQPGTLAQWEAVLREGREGFTGACIAGYPTVMFTRDGVEWFDGFNPYFTRETPIAGTATWDEVAAATWQPKMSGQLALPV